MIYFCGYIIFTLQLGCDIISQNYFRKRFIMEQYLSPNDPRFIADTDSKSIQNAVNAAENGDIRLSPHS